MLKLNHDTFSHKKLWLVLSGFLVVFSVACSKKDKGSSAPAPQPTPPQVLPPTPIYEDYTPGSYRRNNPNYNSKYGNSSDYIWYTYDFGLYGSGKSSRRENEKRITKRETQREEKSSGGQQDDIEWSQPRQEPQTEKQTDETATVRLQGEQRTMRIIRDIKVDTGELELTILKWSEMSEPEKTAIDNLVEGLHQQRPRYSDYVVFPDEMTTTNPKQMDLPKLVADYILKEDLCRNEKDEPCFVTFNEKVFALKIIENSEDLRLQFVPITQFAFGEKYPRVATTEHDSQEVEPEYWRAILLNALQKHAEAKVILYTPGK